MSSTSTPGLMGTMTRRRGCRPRRARSTASPPPRADTLSARLAGASKSMATTPSSATQDMRARTSPTRMGMRTPPVAGIHRVGADTQLKAGILRRQVLHMVITTVDGTPEEETDMEPTQGTRTPPHSRRRAHRPARHRMVHPPWRLAPLQLPQHSRQQRTSHPRWSCTRRTLVSFSPRRCRRCIVQSGPPPQTLGRRRAGEPSRSLCLC